MEVKLSTVSGNGSRGNTVVNTMLQLPLLQEKALLLGS